SLQAKDGIRIVLPSSVANVDQNLEAGSVFPNTERLRLGFRGFSRSTCAAGENHCGLAEQISQRIDVVDAVEHDFEAFALINPRPHTPVGLAMDLDGSI